MPLEPNHIVGLSDDLVRLYADAEAQLLAIIASQASRHAGNPEWARLQLQEINRLQGLITAQVAVIATSGTDAAAVAITQGWSMGEGDAAQEIRDVQRQMERERPTLTMAGAPTAPAPSPAPRGPVTLSPRGAVSTHALGAIISETTGTLTAAHNSILRTIPDAYRQVVREVAQVQLTGTITSQRAQQIALNRWADRGITGFIDRGGRNWTLPAYGEMSVRTAVHRSYVEGHSTQMQGAGFDLVVVSSHPDPAPMCAPYELQVLSLSGANVGNVLIPSAKDGQPVSVNVVASLDEAKRAGYLHTNCRHRHRLYVPGSTPQAAAPMPDPQGYEDTQTQRGLERRVRKWKRREAVALDDNEREYAVAYRKKAQADVRAHVERTGHARRYDREQVRVGVKGATPSPASVPSTATTGA